METQSEHYQESNLMYFLRLLISNWKWLLGLYVIVSIVAVVWVLVIPKWYKSDATVVILSDNASPFSGLLSDFSSFGLNLGGNNNAATYIEYGRSNRIYDKFIEDFNIMEVHELSFKEDAYEVINENLNLIDNENGTFTIVYVFKDDPVKAKEAVAFFYNQLSAIALEVDVADASKFRQYIEKYYQQTKSDLLAKEDSLIQFQKITGLIDLPTQVEATIAGISELEQQKIQFEVEKNYLSEVLVDETQLMDVETRIQSIEDKISQMKKQGQTSIVALDSLPDQGARFLRLQRDILVGEKVAEFLRIQYEQALLDEKKINSNLYLVDPPVVSEKKYKPQRGRSVIIVMFITFAISMVLLRLKDFVEENQNELKKMMS